MISLYHKKSVCNACSDWCVLTWHNIVSPEIQAETPPPRVSVKITRVVTTPIPLALVAPFRPPPWKPGRKTNCFGRLPYLTIKIKFRLSHNTWESKHIKYILGAVYIHLKHYFIFFTPSCSYSQEGCQCCQPKISNCQAGNDPRRPFHFHTATYLLILWQLFSIFIIVAI